VQLPTAVLSLVGLVGLVGRFAGQPPDEERSNVKLDQELLSECQTSKHLKVKAMFWGISKI
jgi:hypothetical protein